MMLQEVMWEEQEPEERWQKKRVILQEKEVWMRGFWECSSIQRVRGA